MLSAIIISQDKKFRDNARELLKGSDLIEVRAELNDFDCATDGRRFGEIRDMQSSIIIVDVTSLEETLEKTIQFFRQSYVFAAGDRTDSDLIFRCMRAGAKEFLSAPIQSEQLFPAIERVRKVARITM